MLEVAGRRSEEMELEVRSWTEEVEKRKFGEREYGALKRRKARHELEIRKSEVESRKSEARS
jgi:hypothetical protein